MNGLIGGHAYTVTQAAKVTARQKTILLIRVRNPWGTSDGEWKGAWSDGSAEWDKVAPEVVESLKVKGKGDGEFWVEIGDYLKYFSSTHICNFTPDFDQDGKEDDLSEWMLSNLYTWSTFSVDTGFNVFQSMSAWYWQNGKPRQKTAIGINTVKCRTKCKSDWIKLQQSNELVHHVLRFRFRFSVEKRHSLNSEGLLQVVIEIQREKIEKTNKKTKDVFIRADLFAVIRFTKL